MILKVKYIIYFTMVIVYTIYDIYFYYFCVLFKTHPKNTSIDLNKPTSDIIFKLENYHLFTRHLFKIET